jgi:hypothetical protein
MFRNVAGSFGIHPAHGPFRASVKTLMKITCNSAVSFLRNTSDGGYKSCPIAGLEGKAPGVSDSQKL